ncbi:MAG: hypothetical protein K8T26_12725 [Lentisphaerae bacterium]|nr:hypothetical protein [Lentisphaerota bacterium]
MSEHKRLPILSLLALAIWVIGVSWSARTWRQLGEAQARWGERRAQLAVMRGLAEEDAAYGAAQAQARAMCSGTADLLTPMLALCPPAMRADESRERVEPLGDGWAWRVRELVFEDVPIDAAMGLVDDAERLSTPWRLRGCEIRASAHTAGNGQITLALGTLQPAP